MIILQFPLTISESRHHQMIWLWLMRLMDWERLSLKTRNGMYGFGFTAGPLSCASHGIPHQSELWPWTIARPLSMGYWHSSGLHSRKKRKRTWCLRVVSWSMWNLQWIIQTMAAILQHQRGWCYGTARKVATCDTNTSILHMTQIPSPAASKGHTLAEC